MVPAPGTKGGQSQNFDFLLGLCRLPQSTLSLPVSFISSPRRLLLFGSLARPPALLDAGLVPYHLPHLGWKDDHVPVPCINPQYVALIPNCSYA